MNYIDHFELTDLYKALFAVLAGLILGFEREMKDKSAGLKTISVICLGSTLFTMISLKVGVEGADPGRIAANIITGIGFLGAGVIFKEGFNVYGLTTAGVIWIAAAIGMSIGFGQVTLSMVILAICLLVIYGTQYFNRFFMPQHNARILNLHFLPEAIGQRREVLQNIKKFTMNQREMKMVRNTSEIIISLDVHVKSERVYDLQNYLLSEEKIKKFSF